MKPLRLYEAVSERWGRWRCPCCGSHMSKPVKQGHSLRVRFRGDMRTQGHVYPRSVPFTRDLWYDQCFRCNNEQGEVELLDWAAMLVRHDDPRGSRVVELCRIVYGWLNETGRTPRKDCRPPWMEEGDRGEARV